MTTVKDFIREQVIARANAAELLSDKLTINGIIIEPGCSADGITVTEGIEQLADVFGAETQTEERETNYESLYTKKVTWFKVGSTHFKQTRYIAKTTEKQEEINDGSDN